MQPAGQLALSDEQRRSRAPLSFGWAALKPIAAAVDAAALVAASALAPAIYGWFFSGHDPIPDVDFLGFGLVATLTFVTLSYLTGGYEPRAEAGRPGVWRGTVSALKLWVITLAFMALCAFLLKIGADFSRGTVIVYALSGGLVIAGQRRFWPELVRRAISRDLVFVTNVLILRVGAESGPSDALRSERLADLAASGLRPAHWDDIPTTPDAAELAAMVERVETLMRRGRIDEIVVVATQSAMGKLDAVFEALRVVPIPVRLVLDPVTRSIYRRSLTRAGSLLLAEYQRAPLTIFERAIKRALDLSVASVALILLSPLFVLTALLIKLDSPGPVLFRQSRRGFGGKTFMILKFRSMTVADNGAVIEQAKKNDARVTRVGKWIRRTSLDELPQLWNVIAGDMSIVGPRPHAVAHDDYYARFIEAYAFRHHAKPGLTGWAQVKGLRGETPKIENMEARIEKDLWYIDNWSIWLDISIILRTTLVVLGQKTAY